MKLSNALFPSFALVLALPFSGSFTRSASAPIATAPTAAAAALKIDGGHSNVLFRIQHFGVSNFYGRFNSVGGEVTWDSAKPEASSISIEIDAASIDTNDKKRDEHIRGVDFLSAKEFPTLTFKSKSVAKKGDKLEVVGDLTMHGVTKPVTALVTITGEGETMYGYRAGFETSFDIKRSEFGVSGVPGGVGEDIHVIVAIEAVKS